MCIVFSPAPSTSNYYNSPNFIYSSETLEAGHDIEELVSHGLELLSTLLPSTSTPQTMK